MLRLLLFASLAIGCMCLERRFTKSSFNDYKNINGPAFFHDFKVNHENWYHEFTAVPESNNRLYFAETSKEPVPEPHFTCQEGSFNLVSFAFEFPEDRHYRLVIKLERPNSFQEWTVISTVFTPPAEEDQGFAATHAVEAKTLTEEVILDLKKSELLFRKELYLDIDWIHNLFRSNEKPKHSHNVKDDSSKPSFVALPLIVNEGVLAALKKERDVMEEHVEKLRKEENIIRNNRSS